MTTTDLSHFIAGHTRASHGTGTHQRRNPSDRRDVLHHAAIGDASDVAAAVDAASAALVSWRRTTGPARSELLHRWGETIAARAEELAQAIAREVGKPIGEARGEVGRAVVICRYYAGEAVRDVGSVIPAQAADTMQYTLHDPVGVVGLITPWNFPIAIPLWKAAPALAFGNTVVLKPSEHSTGIAAALAETAKAAGIPDGVFNVVMGDGTTGAALIEHSGIQAVSFTGSSAVGARVQASAAARNVRCQTEMGGKNVVIVAADGDLDRAATLVAAGAFRYAGQKCTATSRVVVVGSVLESFLSKLDAAMQQLSPGPVTDPASAIGPLITEAAKERVELAIRTAGLAADFQVAIPSGREWSHGNWVAPQLFRLNDASHRLAREELFGPVLVALEARDIEHALRLANDTRYGLSASFFTRDLHAAFAYIREIEVGLVRVNGDTTGVDPHAPFGGIKGSSSGSREQGRAARDFYTETRTVQIHT